MRWPTPVTTPLPSATDVLIIGQSAAGYGCAFGLAEAGIDFALIGEPGSEDHAPPAFIGGLVDNITRVHHAYGDDTARQVWQCSQEAAAQFARQLTAWQVPWHNHAKLRLHHSEHQQTEGRQAHKLLVRLGLGSVIAGQNQGRWAVAREGVLIHNEQGQGYTFAPAAMSGQLAKALPCTAGRFSSPEQLRGAGAGFSACTDSGQSIAATMVVIACQQALLRLRPFYREVFIPYGDQFQRHEVSGVLPRRESCLFYADHGYVYGYHLADQGQLLLAGGRFVEKGARIGEQGHRLSAKVSAYLSQRGGELFGQPLPPPAEAQGFFDTRSCDELPVIGPDFREPQLLLAGGFMGGGMGLGWYAGRKLAELIATGACPSLPRALWPTRLRSL